MAQRKDRPILFEVVQKGAETRAPATRRGSGSGLSEFARRLRANPEVRQPVRPSGPTPGDEIVDVEPVDRPDSAGGLTALIERFKNGKLHLAISWTAIAGLGLFALLLILLSFYIGSQWARSSLVVAAPKSDDPLERALEGDPQSSVLEIPDSQHRSGGRIATPPRNEPHAASESGTPTVIPATTLDSPRETPREKGRHYLVIQHFKKTDVSDAEAAEQFIRVNGIPCSIYGSTKDLRLIATQGFLIDQKDAAAKQAEQRKCDDLKRRIKELGKQYAKTGRYVFDQCYADKY